MSRANLKKSLGEGGAFIGDSHGEDRLLDVLTALANGGDSISAKQAVATTGIKASMVVDSPSRIGTLYVNVGTTGDGNQTDVDVLVNGVSKGQIIIDNTEADGFKQGLAVNVDVEAGDLVEIDFTAVATNNANVAATVRMKPVTVEV